MPQRIEVDLERCQRITGYAPSLASESARLAPEEWDWRLCVHRAVEQLLVPVVRLADVYRLLLVEDRRLTQAVADGELDRGARAARLRDVSQRVEAVGGNDPAAVSRRNEPQATAEEIADAREIVIEALAR